MNLKTLHQNINFMIADLKSGSYAHFLDTWVLEEDLNWTIKSTGSREELIDEMGEFTNDVLTDLQAISKLKSHEQSDENSFIFDVSAIKDHRGLDFIKFEFDIKKDHFVMHLRQPQIDADPDPHLDALYAASDDPSISAVELIQKYNEYVEEFGDRFNYPILQKTFDQQEAGLFIKEIEEFFQIILPATYKDFIIKHGVFWIENEYQKLEGLLNPCIKADWSIGPITEYDREYFKTHGHVYEDHSVEIQMIVDNSVVFYKSIQTDGLEMWVFYKESDDKPAKIKHYYEDDYRSFFSLETYDFEEFVAEKVREIIERL